MADPKIEIEVVVNGEKVVVDVNPNAALSALIAEALRKTHNNGQPVENWDLKNAAGELIDRNTKYKDLPPGTRLFLNVRAGVGGCE